VATVDYPAYGHVGTGLYPELIDCVDTLAMPISWQRDAEMAKRGY